MAGKNLKSKRSITLKFFSQQKIKYSLPDCLSLFIVTLLFFLLVTPANAYDVVIGWDPNNEQNLEGYVLYVDDGTTETPYEYVDNYPLEDIDPNNPRAKITDLQNTIAYYFVVTAYDTDGNESDYSDEICVMLGQACPESYLASRNSLSNETESTGIAGDPPIDDEPADQSPWSLFMSMWLKLSIGQE